MKLILAFLMNLFILCLSNKQGIVVNEHGKMYLYENTREVHFYLNQTSFIHNALLIHENVNKLKKLCSKTFPHQNCEFFMQNMRYNKAQIDKDIAYLRTRKSISKRHVAVPTFVAGGIMAGLAYVAERKKRAATERNRELRKIQQLEQQLAILKDSLEVNQRALSGVLQILREHEEKIKNLEGTVMNLNEFYDLLHICSALMIKHYANIHTMELFFREDIGAEFFSIVDLDQYEEQKKSNRDIGYWIYIATIGNTRLNICIRHTSGLE